MFPLSTFITVKSICMELLMSTTRGHYEFNYSMNTMLCVSTTLTHKQQSRFVDSLVTLVEPIMLQRCKLYHHKNYLIFHHCFYRATGNTIDLTNILCNANTGSFPCFSHCIDNEGYSNRACHEVYIDCGKNLLSCSKMGMITILIIL